MAKKDSDKRARSGKSRRKSIERWSAAVNRTNDAMDLEPGVFKIKDPDRLAASLKKSAEASRRRKAEPFRSAMSMLNFYINRAGKNLSQAQLDRLDRAKDALRRQFGRD